MRRLRLRARLTAGVLVGVAVAAALAGCGLNVKGMDLFLLTRVGHGHELALLVNDRGTISCNGGRPRPLAGPLLLQARDLVSGLDSDAGLNIPVPKNSYYHYHVTLEFGTVSFPDTAASHHPLLAQVVQFTLKAARQACGLKG